MKHYLLAFCSICTFFSSTQTKQKETIILSFNVLFNPNESIIEKHARKSLTLFKSINLFFSGIPKKKEMKDKLFSVLPHVPLAQISIDPASWKTDYIPWDDIYPYPPILNQFITSTTLQQENAIYTKVIEHIKKDQHIKSNHKIILKAIADFLFRSAYMNKVMQPVAQVIDLVKKLQQENYTVLLTAGVPGYAWDTFLADYPQAKIISQLFTPDTIYISGKEHVLPTSEKFYQKIIRSKHLNPKDCIVIAQNTHDLAYPKKIGMKTLAYNAQKDNFKTFSQHLMNMLKKS